LNQDIGLAADDCRCLRRSGAYFAPYRLIIERLCLLSLLLLFGVLGLLRIDGGRLSERDAGTKPQRHEC